jgi:hypothetical protein
MGLISLFQVSLFGSILYQLEIEVQHQVVYSSVVLLSILLFFCLFEMIYVKVLYKLSNTNSVGMCHDNYGLIISSC